MKTILYNIFKTTNAMMLTKVILETPYKVLQITENIYSKTDRTFSESL